MVIVLFEDSRDYFGGFSMRINTKQDIKTLIDEFRKLANKENIDYCAASFQKFLGDKGIESAFLYDVRNILWR